LKRTLKKYTFKLLTPFFSVFIKKRKNFSLFGNGYGKFSDNSKYLFLYLLKNKQKNIFYVLDSKEEYQKLKHIYPVIYKNSISTFFKVLRSEYFFFTHNINDVFYGKRKSTIAVNLFHGSGIKKMGFDSEVDLKWIVRMKKLGLKLPYDKWDFLSTAHENCNFIFKSSTHICDEKIIATGLPRNDYLFDNKYNTEKINKLKINIFGEKNKKIILYAPTFRDYESGEIKDILNNIMRLFKDMSISNNFIFGVRLHPKDVSLIDKRAFSTHVINLTNYNVLEELLLSADVLITDYSSIFLDYSILERPVLLYIHDFLKYQKVRGGFYFDFKNDFKGYGISETLNELENNLLKAQTFTNPNFYKKYNTKNASSNILNAIGFNLSKNNI